MTFRHPTLTTAVLSLSLLLLIAGPTLAQPEEEHQGGEPECMGPWDPFCPLDGGSGSGGGSGLGCYTCEWDDVEQRPYCNLVPNAECCASYLTGCDDSEGVCDHTGYCLWT